MKYKVKEEAQQKRPPRKSARQRMLEDEPVQEAAIEVDLKIRSHKIQPLIKTTLFKDTRVPQIRLSGKWLHQLGFEENKRIRIIPSKGQLILQVEESSSNAPENIPGAIQSDVPGGRPPG